MPVYLLLAMQAAGMITDWMGTKNQQQMASVGARLQNLGIEANIQQTRLEAEDASLQALKNLRQTLGTQIAIFAARGTKTGAGSAFGLLNQNISNFNADERMRRLNLLGRESALKGGGLITKLNEQAENAKLWQGFRERTLNKIPTSSAAYGQLGKSFGLTQLG